MANQSPGSFFDVAVWLAEISANDGGLDRGTERGALELFGPLFGRPFPSSRSDHSGGERPPFDLVLMLKVLVLQPMSFAARRANAVPDEGLAVVMRIFGPGLA